MKRYNSYFQDILGQERVVDPLMQALGKDQVSHSYIFAGPEGTQRAEMARCFAKALFSQGNSSPDISTQKVGDHNHPDLIEVFPDGASIKIKQIRELRQDISIKPFEAQYKIYIIHQADTMKDPAQNALLKTLEEPPEYAIIILITNSLSALLPTIQSRSQALKFLPLGEERIQEYLIYQKGLSPSKAREIALIANGSIENAVKWAGEDHILQERKDLLKDLLNILKGDTPLVFQLALWFKEQKEKTNQWLDFIIIWFRDVALQKELGDNPYTIHKEYRKLLEEFTKHLSYEQINAIIEDVSQSKNNMRYNVNLQLNIESMLLKMQEGCYGNGSRNTL